MACVNCNKIRTALLHGKMADAVGLTVDALREKIGWTVDEPAPVAEPEGKADDTKAKKAA